MLKEFGIVSEEDKNENADNVFSVTKLFEQDMATFSKRREQLEQNKAKLYGTIWGQCSPVLKSKVIGDAEYKVHAKEFDCVWLLQKLKKTCAGIDNNSNTYVATYTVLKISTLYVKRKMKLSRHITKGSKQLWIL